MHPLQPEYGHEDPILWYMNNLQVRAPRKRRSRLLVR
jgi:hypothetical protein